MCLIKFCRPQWTYMSEKNDFLWTKQLLNWQDKHWHHNMILQYNYNSVTSTCKPEDGWSDNLKYCYKYNMLCQPCSSLLTYYHFTFQVCLIKFLVWSNIQSSRIFVHGFAVYSTQVFFYIVLSRVQPTSS